MKARWLPWVLAGLCLLAGAAVLLLTVLFTRGVSYGTALPPVEHIPDNRYGVNVELDKIVNQTDIRRSVQMIHDAGFGFVRQVFAWNEIEIAAKGDFYDHKNSRSAWDKYDRLVDAADAAGLQVIARLERPPAWARDPGSDETAPPRDFADYGDFVAAFVRHFKGRIHYIQIWNEPNRFEDWGRRPVDPAAYTRLLQIGYRRGKEADPGIVVLSAALTPTTDCCLKNRPDPLYLQQMYAAGARGFFDVLGAQAYGLRAGPEDPWQDLPFRPNDARKAVIDGHNTNFGRLVLDRQVMVRNGDSTKPVWVSEFGWNALPPDWRGDPSPWGSVSPELQARYTVEAFQRAQREWPWLGVMNLWLFQDPTPAERDPTQFFGLVDRDFEPRPVYDAVRAFIVHQAAAAVTGGYAADGPAAAYQGPWQAVASGRVSPVSGATVKLRFTGSAIALRAARGPDRGIAYLAVDGWPTYATDIPKDSAGRAALDLYSPTEEPALVPVASGLPYGLHELTLTVSGLANPRAGGPGVEVDGFVIGLTPDGRPVYIGALLLVAGGLLLAWQAGALVRRRLAFSVKVPALPGGAVMAATAGSLAVLYFGRSLPVTLLGAALFALLAAGWPGLALPWIALSLPFYLQPLHVAGGAIPLSEALVGLALAALLARTVCQGTWAWPRTVFGLPALIFFAAAGASVLAAGYPRYALREWRTDILEPLVLFGLLLLARPRVKLVVDFLLLGGLIVAVTGFVQFALGRGIEAEQVLRMVGVYRSPDNFALYLGRLVPLAAALALLAPAARKWRLLYGAGAVLGLLAVTLSFTRGAWIGALVSLLVVAGLAGRRWLAAGAAAGALAALALGAVQAQRVRSLFHLAPGTTTYTRIELWRSATRMIADHPLWGVGPDNFLYQYPRYILPDARGEPDLSHPHNLVLDFWNSTGAAGLAAAAWLLVVFFRQAAGVLTRAAGWERALAAGLLASMIDAVVHGLVDNSYFLIDLSALFWLTLALLQLLEWDSPRQEETAA